MTLWIHSLKNEYIFSRTEKTSQQQRNYIHLLNAQQTDKRDRYIQKQFVATKEQWRRPRNRVFANNISYKLMEN